MFKKGDAPMKLTKKRIILIILGVLAIVILSTVAYLYFSLSGNPIVMWQQKQAVLRIYEERYDENFKVIRSNYDYKQHKYFYTLEPEENSDFQFTTSVYESRQRDPYAELRAEDFIRQIVEEALTNSLNPQTTTMNIYEEYDAAGDTESDVLKRLGQNRYVISINIDVELLDSEEVDAATIEMGHKIDSALDTSLGGLKLRVSVYDGTNYHFGFVDIR
jgi:flagellar basal body-associated protein FliL